MRNRYRQEIKWKWVSQKYIMKTLASRDRHVLDRLLRHYRLIYGLFNDAVSSSDNAVYNGEMNWKGCRRKWSSPTFVLWPSNACHNSQCHARDVEVLLWCLVQFVLHLHTAKCRLHLPPQAM
jgi:hypothetical protein